MEKRFVLGLLIVAACVNCYSQKPKDGTYTYAIIWDEFQGKFLGATCIVRIKGDSIYVINNGSITGVKGSIIDSGIIMKNRKTGKWIIGNSEKDKDAPDPGKCGNGPAAIDFIHKRYYTC